MQVGVIGINHFSSSLSERERVAKIFQKSFDLNAKELEASYVLLSTCNRTELYFSSPQLTETHSAILQILRSKSAESFEHSLYSYFCCECFLHLARVISGMDSLIFGESEIQRQAKFAYESYRKQQMLTPSLHFLFQKGLKIGKEMRTSFLPAQNRLPQTIFSLLEGVDVKNSRLLFIGNSAINRGLMTYFLKKGCKDLTLCTRMSTECSHVDVKNWEVLESWTEYDAVIAGTYHDEFILKPAPALDELTRTIFLFDLGVPRNIDPLLCRHPFLHLHNLDALCQMANKTKKTCEKEIQLCETQIERAVQRQMELFRRREQARWRYAAICEELSCALAH